MSELLVIIGIFLALEGAIYAAAPHFVRRMSAQVLATPPSVLRAGGFFALVLGVFLVWLIKG